MYFKIAGIDARPPNNPRQFDNTIFLVDTGGLRIMFRGDNRRDPNPHIWEMIGQIDSALLLIDASVQVLSHEQADGLAVKLGAKVVVPRHDSLRDIIQRRSTLQTANQFVAVRDHIKPDGPSYALT